MSLPWDYPQPFIMPISVKAEQIDELNHVNNAVYVQWMEDCAWQHSAQLGLGLQRFTELDRSMAIVRHEIDYLASAKLADALLLGTWLLKPQGRLIKLERCFQLLRPADNCCLLRAKTSFVCVQMSSGRPKRIPDEFLAAYGTVWQKCH